jgi:hypothetical protein
MKKYIILFLLLNVLCPLIKCGEPQGTYSYGKYEGNQVVVFGNDPAIYEKPLINSKVLFEPVPGTVLKLIDIAPGSMEFNGYTEGWYKVSYKEKDKALISGYIWGGSLAKAYVMGDFDNDGQKETVVMGAKYVKSEAGKKNAKLRYIKNGIAKNVLLFAPLGSYYTDERMFNENGIKAEMTDSKGFSPPIKLFKIEFSAESCDHAYGDMYFLWDGKSLQKAFEALAGASDEIGGRVRVLLPSSGKTKPNGITVVTAWVPHNNDDRSKPHDVEIDTENYKWNGQHIVLENSKEEKIKWAVFKKIYPDLAD